MTNMSIRPFKSNNYSLNNPGYAIKNINREVTLLIQLQTDLQMVHRNSSLRVRLRAALHKLHRRFGSSRPRLVLNIVSPTRQVQLRLQRSYPVQVRPSQDLQYRLSVFRLRRPRIPLRLIWSETISPTITRGVHKTAQHRSRSVADRDSGSDAWELGQSECGWRLGALSG